ncbi:MAG: phosphotransferase [Chloroflexota bacterium]|nr:phosphotransferase [Chloroflexota bacterium]
MAVEQGWPRRFDFVPLSAKEASALIGEAVLGIEPLSGGLRNTNYRLVRAAQPEPVVLRIYTADPSACRREQRLLELVRLQVPVPRVLRAEPFARPPWSLMTFIEGERFDSILKAASNIEVDHLSYSAGQVLAHIHAFTFPRGGFFGPELQIAESLGDEYGWHQMLEGWLTGGRVNVRLGEDLARRLLRFVSDNAWREDQMRFAGPCLSHSDYKPWNLLVRGGGIAAVLDWEFAFANAPLNDVGNFLRYSARHPAEYESGFVRGYLAAGGVLPEDWQRLSRMVDLINLCSFLDHPEDDPAVSSDVRPLIQATLDAYA